MFSASEDFSISFRSCTCKGIRSSEPVKLGEGHTHLLSMLKPTMHQGIDYNPMLDSNSDKDKDCGDNYVKSSNSLDDCFQKNKSEAYVKSKNRSHLLSAVMLIDFGNTRRPFRSEI